MKLSTVGGQGTIGNIGSAISRRSMNPYCRRVSAEVTVDIADRVDQSHVRVHWK